MLYLGDSQSVGPGPAVSALPGNLLEIQVLGSYPRSAESSTQRVVPVNCLLISPLGDSDACL